MAAVGGGTWRTSEVKASLGGGRLRALGRRAVAQRLSREKQGRDDDGKEMRRACWFGGGGFCKIAEPFI